MRKLIIIGLFIAVSCSLSVVSQSGCGKGVNPAATASTTSTITTTTTTTTTTFTISGAVKFAGTSDGVKSGVAITYSGAASGSTTTNTNTGTYEITGLSNGSYTVTASKTNWITSSETITVSGTSETVDLRLYPASWEVLRTGGTEMFYSIWPDSTYESIANYYVVGKDSDSRGVILKSAAGNRTSWTTVVSPTTDPLVAIIFNEGQAFVASRTYSVWSSSDMSSFNFYTRREVAGYPNWYSIALALELAVNENGVLYKITNDTTGHLSGESSSNFLSAFMMDQDIALAVGQDGLCRKWTSNQGWETLTVDPAASDLIGAFYSLFMAYLPSNSKPALITSSDGAVYSSRGGISATAEGWSQWTKELEGIPYTLRGIYMDPMGSIEGTTTYIVGSNGFIMRHR